ncbi:MAG: hypothetical protein ICV85_09540 [Tolypothrix sp. T3-bin4]|nr:hypothetical protein [Tolypothrix sp. T3-bin4]
MHTIALIGIVKDDEGNEKVLAIDLDDTVQDQQKDKSNTDEVENAVLWDPKELVDTAEAYSTPSSTEMSVETGFDADVHLEMYQRPLAQKEWCNIL